MQTPKNGRSILVGEDELEVRGYFEMVLGCLGYSVELAQDSDELLSVVRSSSAELCAVLLDLGLPRRDGLDTLREIRRIDRDLPVIVISSASSPVDIAAAMKGGATEFLAKPVSHEDLRDALAKALDRKTVADVPSQRGAGGSGGVCFGASPKMIQIHSLVRQVGWSEAPVLIQGETGTGKEVIARELHSHSPRANKPFLKLNCAALPSELVESELFGYERGAFTGAIQKKAGMFEMADGGTMLLDEIGDMAINLQAKLLQVLQDQEFQRIGGKEPIRVNVRILAATHRDLEQAIFDKSFREDLYYRLNVVNIQLPPLRDRKEDILALAEVLVKKHTVEGIPIPQFTAELTHALMAYHWPGNVRELENVVRKLIILSNPGVIAEELTARTERKLAVPVAVPERRATADPPQKPSAPGPASVFDQATKAKRQTETEAILAALNSTHWNRKRAADLLNVEYKALLYKIKKLGVDGRPSSPRSNGGSRITSA